MAAAGILLFGTHLYHAVRTGPVPRAALHAPAVGTTVAQAQPLELPAQTMPVPMLPSQSSPSLGGPPAAQPQSVGPPAPAPVFPPPPTAPKKPAGFIGPEAPVSGPQWKGGPLPALSPEVLRAMMDPRAARGAQRLRRLGITLPEEPTPPAPGVTPDRGSRLAVRPTSPAGTGGEAAQAPRGEGKPAPPAGKAVAAAPPKGEVRPPAVLSAGSGAAAGTASKANPAAPPAGAGGAAEPPAGGRAAEGTKNGTGKDVGEPSATPTDSEAPIRLQARLDRPRPEYRVGEWVALRFFASRPAHLRAYRVDAAGRVTRLFSTYSREESGQPARSFSMMVKAGQPRPGHERVVAIGSARPLTRDELLDCLRSYLGEGPSENPAPGPDAVSRPSDGATTPAGAPPAPMPLADALRAVMEAVGRGGDLPAGMAGLDRSAWSVAVGRFVSSPRKLQQSAAGPEPAGAGPAP